MNLPGPYNFLPFVLLAFIASETASATGDSQPRLNPFELPPGIYSADNAPKVQKQNLKLQAIFDIDGKRIATISGVNFMKGDLVFGKKITDISPNQVTLDAGGKEEILVLERTRFQIQKGSKK